MPTSRHFRALATVLAGLPLSLCLSLPARPQQAPRILGAITAARRAPLRGTVPPQALQARDEGAVAAGLRLPRVVLWIAPTPQQQAALALLLRQQRDPLSPNYHRWLTPEEYAARFGAAAADLDAIRAWLTAHDLTVTEIARGVQLRCRCRYRRGGGGGAGGPDS